MTCTPLTDVIKKRHDQSIRSFLVHFGFCLCLPIQLSHVIALFLVHFVIKYLFFVVRWSQTILRLSKKKNGKIKKTLCEGIMNMFCSIDFGQRNQEPQLVLFNHIRIELLNRDIITCSNFNLTEKKIWKQFLQRKEDRKKETFFQKCEFTEEKLLVRYSSGEHICLK